VWRAAAGRGSVGAPAVGDRVTVTASVDRWVYALDTRTGRLFWRFRGDAPFGTGPLVSGGKVFVASEGHEGRVTAIRLESGKRAWQTAVGDVASPLAIRDTLVYGATQSGGEHGRVFALGTQKGHVLWSRAIGGTRSGPLIAGQQLVVVTLTDSIFVLDRLNGRVVTRAALSTSTIAPLALAGDSTAILASPGGIVMGITLPSGAERWRVVTGAPMAGAPAVAHDTVFALTNDCVLWTIPLASPSVADSAGLGCGTSVGATVLRSGVLIATVRGEVLLFDRGSGARVWADTLSSPLRHPPIVRNRQMFVAPTDGRVVSFR
jgi:outer membrane protein assembly factor BamB